MGPENVNKKRGLTMRLPFTVFTAQFASPNMEFLVMTGQPWFFGERLVTPRVRAWNPLERGGCDFQVYSLIVRALIMPVTESSSTSWVVALRRYLWRSSRLAQVLPLKVVSHRSFTWEHLTTSWIFALRSRRLIGVLGLIVLPHTINVTQNFDTSWVFALLWLLT